MSLASLNELSKAIAERNTSVGQAILIGDVDYGKPDWHRERRRQEQLYNRWRNGTYTIDQDVIKGFLESTLNQALACQQHKGLRPWDVVNLTTKLDKKQPWIGIEYETGYDSREDYQKVINFFWNNFEHSAIDGEGAGEFPAELTLAPVNYNDFMEEEGQMEKLLKFIEENKIATTRWAADENEADDLDIDEFHIGTHCNISTPAYRKAVDSKRTQIECVLNASLRKMGDASKRRLFGRIPYGGFNANSNLHGCWIEGKLFNSTADIKQWKKYKAVIGKIAEVIEALSVAKIPSAKENPNAEWWESETLYPCVTNFVGILSGRVDISELKLGFTSKDPWL